MKKKTIIISFLGIFLALFLVKALLNVQPKEIANAPDWQTVEAAEKQALDQNKLIFVDVYEVGCKYCRAMEREVFPDSTVRQVLDAGYIPVKINGKSEELITFNGRSVPQVEWAKEYGVYAFPSALIIDTEGNLIKKNTGFMGVDDLRRFLYLNKEKTSL